MTIQYRNSFRDTLAFAWYHYTHTWIAWLILGLFLAVTLPTTIRSVSPEMDGPVAVLALILTELFLVSSLVVVTAVLTVASMISRRNKTFLTDHTLTLSPQGVTEQTAFSTTTHTWTGIVRVARTSRHLFLYIAQHAAHIVPRRAVGTPQEWDALYEYIRNAVAAQRAA